MKKKQNRNYKELGIGRGIFAVVVVFILGMLIAFFVVENSYPSKASNDGWLGFLGAMFGSIISGAITFLVLFINRNDARKSAEANKIQTDHIQSENRQQFQESMKQQSAILKYQCNMKLCDDVMNLTAELINLTRDYCTNAYGNAYKLYIEKKWRTSEICDILEMKLKYVESSEEFVKEAKAFQIIYDKDNPDHKKINNTKEALKTASEKLCKLAVELCARIMKENELL